MMQSLPTIGGGPRDIAIDFFGNRGVPHALSRRIRFGALVRVFGFLPLLVWPTWLMLSSFAAKVPDSEIA